MDIRIFTCIQGRQDITKAFFLHLKHLRKETGKALPITFAYSKDADFEAVKDLMTEKDQAVKAPNKPLSFKHNAGMTAVLKGTKESHILHLGSDDFVSADYVKFCYSKPSDFAGIQTLYFVDLPNKKAKLCRYVTRDRVMGAGRLFSRKLLMRTMGPKYRVRRTWYSFRRGEEVHVPEDLGELMAYDKILDYQIGNKKQCALWMHPADRGLDNMSHEVLKRLGYKPAVWDGHFETPQIVDVKNGTNITSFQNIRGKEVKFEEAMKFVSVEIES